MVLVLDNYDSFTYNLVQYLGELGAEVTVVRNDAEGVADIEGRRPERIVIAEGLEIGIVAGERPIFRVQCNRALQVSDRFCMLVPLGMGDSEHVEGVVVIGILIADQAEMGDGLIVLTTIDRERCRVQALVDGLRRCFSLRRLSLTDIEIQPNPLVQFLFFGVLPENGFEQADGFGVGVPLKCLEPSLIDSDGLEIGRTPLRRSRLRLVWRWAV